MRKGFSAFLEERAGRIGRIWRSRRAGRPRRKRSLFGEDSKLEIANKLVTILALGFGVWAYFFSVKPVFDKEERLQAQTRRAENLQRRVDEQRQGLSRQSQRLDRLQALLGNNRKGIVLSYLAEIRNTIEQDARAYQDMAPVQDKAPVGFDLRDYSLAWAAAQLKRLGQPQPGSAEAYEKDALDFFQAFVDGRVPPGTADVGWLSPLLDAYDRESRASGATAP